MHRPGFGTVSLVAGLLLAAAAALPAAEFDSQAGKELPELVELYKNFHSHPELSYFEKETSAKVAGLLAGYGYSVSWPVGRYADSTRVCYGVVAVLKNGEGPTVLVRGDMDALPIEEKTGLAWASRVRMTDISGEEVGVMHACGHDVHTTVLLGTARALADLKGRWRGTLIIIGQTAEERGGGARALLADGLYTRWPLPDYAIAEHVDPTLEAGKIGYCPGWAMANVDMVDIAVRGIGSHGAQPQQGKDPIVLSAQIINALQTLVSRSINPVEVGVVTVGSIHGGSKHNIIPDEVKLQLTVRSFTEEVRSTLLDGIKRIAVETARAYGVPEDRLPVVDIGVEFTPSLYNDPSLVQRTVGAIGRELGSANLVQIPPTTGGEDFSEYGRTQHKVPVFMLRLGTAPPGSDTEHCPGLHSALYHPDIEPSLTTGVRAMTAAAIELLGK